MVPSEQIMRVLVVDDDDGIRDILALALEAEGHQVRAARDGREALGLLDRFRPDVILLDLMMPVMDGAAFRARQLAHKGWAGIPVVVLSARHNLTAGTDGLRAAAVLPKPFELDTLMETVRALA